MVARASRLVTLDEEAAGATTTEASFALRPAREGHAAMTVPDRIDRVARETFGFETLRTGQREAIEALLDGRATASSSSTAWLASCSGARKTNSRASSASSAKAASRSAAAMVELSWAAPPAARSRRSSTCSRWSAMSGETTTVAPGVRRPAIW